MMLIVFLFNGCGDAGSQGIDTPVVLPMDSVPNTKVEANPIIDYNQWKIENGKFYIGGVWKFLKIAKPLRDFSSAFQVNQLIADLDKLKAKYYNTIEINCYWNQFDTNGDGIPDKSLEPLNKLINAIYAKGMYPCLSVETYSVGGGQIPAGFSLYNDNWSPKRVIKMVDDHWGYWLNKAKTIDSLDQCSDCYEKLTNNF